MQYIILCVISFAFLGSTIFTDSTAFNDFKDEFDSWSLNHAKKYASDTEYLHRFAVYLDNKRRIDQLNQESEAKGGATFGINQFADLTPEEFRMYLGYVPSNRTKPKNTLKLKVGNAPASWDWDSQGKITPVKNQKQCGSCWAFSATENIESVWMIAKGINARNFNPLSPQQIVDCDKSDGGCNGGDTTSAFDYVIHAGGQEPERNYPYTARNGRCDFSPHKVEVTISSYKYATNSKNEDEMKEATYSVAPLSVCVDAEPWQFYTKGIMKKHQCGQSLDHCTQITAYDTSDREPYWKVRNSWGENWGESGFIRLEYGTNTCGIADEATTAVV